MSALERAIAVIKDEIDDYPKAALLRTEGTQFDFGRACGYQQGLLRALEMLEQAMAEADERSSFSKKTPSRV
jgi:hypothetical protein